MYHKIPPALCYKLPKLSTPQFSLSFALAAQSLHFLLTLCCSFSQHIMLQLHVPSYSTKDPYGAGIFRDTHTITTCSFLSFAGESHNCSEDTFYRRERQRSFKQLKRPSAPLGSCGAQVYSHSKLSLTSQGYPSLPILLSLHQLTFCFYSQQNRIYSLQMPSSLPTFNLLLNLSLLHFPFHVISGLP